MFLNSVGQADSPANGCGMIATAPMAPGKKSTKMRPGISNTARSLCSQDWCQKNPQGTTADFKEYF
ncbi:hypothetical protein BYT27DRAFT_7117515 [Phlegmacium glaucopus]|nr:hypothetical protein BYT27DRAFT_7117515 [Phlegmacium glaucopus]